MRQAFVLASLLPLGFLLAGCGGSGSHPTPSASYTIQLTAQPTAKNSSDTEVSYGKQLSFQVTISGGSTSDSGYPDQIKLVTPADQTLLIDTNQCLSNATHQSVCSFTLKNIYAGPKADEHLTDQIQVQANANGGTIQSNIVPIDLTGFQSACSDTICLTDLTHSQDYATNSNFDKPGLHHNSLEYQYKISVGNPTKVGANSDATLQQAELTYPTNKMGLLDKSCDATSCTYTLQNENTTTASLNNTSDAITASAHLSGETSGSAASVSSPIALTLPTVNSCQMTDANNQTEQGVSLGTGKLDVYQGGTALTASGYTPDAMQQLYPVKIKDDTSQLPYPIHSRLIALTVSDPQYLFGPDANEGITAKTKVNKTLTADKYLNDNSCAEANAAYNNFYETTGDNKIATPYKPSTLDVTQQCKDGQPQTRLVYYAVPNGIPPSKNGWPVVIMLHGSAGQTSTGYYLSNGVQATGTANANVFNNQWDWSAWETDSTQPAPPDSGNCSYSYYVRMRLIETWLSRGFAVIVPTTWNAGPYDWWNFEPSYSKPWPYTGGATGNWPRPGQIDVKGVDKDQNYNSTLTYLHEAYWPGMDEQFIQKLMAYINKPSDYDSGAGDLKFDTNNLFLMGYSAGANMVSRLINEFPSMTYTDKNNASHAFPKIKGAIILSGGSYACYLSDNKTCPADALEENYQTVDNIAGNGSVPKHPPTLIAQSLYDDNAGPVGPSTGLAGSVYYQSYLDICKSGTACRPSNDIGTGVLDQAKYQPLNPVTIIHSNNTHIKHFYFPEMVIPSLNLLLNNTCVAKAPN